MLRKCLPAIVVCLLVLSGTTLQGQSKNKKPYVVFVTGDHEYGSELTMPVVAAELEKNYNMRTRVLKSSPHHESEANIPGLEALDSADLVIFYLRWRLLPAEQLAPIERYLQSGKPLIGFRTTTHSFNYKQDDPLHKWNAFAEWAFGAPPGWGGKAKHTHYGHESSTDVTIIPKAAKHPILKGVAPSFHVRSWLYRVLPDYPSQGSEWLMMGKSINPSSAAIDNPVSWTFTTAQGARSFMTTMGHPDDFDVEPFQRMVFNAICWALNKPNKYWKGKIDFNIPYGKHEVSTDK